MDDLALLFGITPEKAMECWRELRRAMDWANYHSTVETSNKTRHEAPPSSIFSFVEQRLAKRTTGKEKEKTKIKEEMDEFYQNHGEKRIDTITKSFARPHFVYVNQQRLTVAQSVSANRRGQGTATAWSAEAKRFRETRNNPQHASQRNPQMQRLPSIHELKPFESQTYVFNLPGHCSVKFGPANVFPASASTGGKPLITGGQQQQQQSQQPPQMTAGMKIPNNNNMSVSGAAPSSSTVVDPFEGARSLSTTASLALSRMPASNVNASEDFNRETKTGGGFTTTTTGTASTTTGGQPRIGNPTSTSVSPMGEFRASRSKRVRTESETESEEDIYA